MPRPLKGAAPELQYSLTPPSFMRALYIRRTRVQIVGPTMYEITLENSTETLYRGISTGSEWSGASRFSLFLNPHVFKPIAHYRP
jgi:hypothetical protein